MSAEETIVPAEIDALLGKLKREAEESGYHLNPDIDFTRDLIKGILVNEKRYGYWACPCRLASGNREEDLDIICPCDYRDPDLNDWGMCYCSLYVSEEVLGGKKAVHPIPERRRSGEQPVKKRETARHTMAPGIPITIWRCRVCGYLCARDEPPLVCPICKAKKERFERFLSP